MEVVTANQRTHPPTWALLQRHLIEAMNEAGYLFLNKYTREDGTLLWREHWPGMDGSDDAYESFYTFPLFYALGGAEDYRYLARKQWEAMTWQFTEYGQLHREFDATMTGCTMERVIFIFIFWLYLNLTRCGIINVRFGLLIFIPVKIQKLITTTQNCV